MRGVPADGPGPHLVQPVHAVGDLQQHTKVAARATAHGPVEPRVLLRAGRDDAAVGKRHPERFHQIALDAEGPRRIAVAATLHEAPHAHAAARSRGHMPAGVVHRAVEMVEIGARQHMHAFAG
ncbi:hypothetical protein D3C71_1519800 [compost metagenome]